MGYHNFNPSTPDLSYHQSSSTSIPSSSLSSTTPFAETALASFCTTPPNKSPKTPFSSTPRTRTISLLARRIASSSALRIVPDTRSTRNTHGRSRPPFGRRIPAPPPSTAGTWVMYVSADQTRRKAARGQRIIAVDVAGERYLTVGMLEIASEWSEWYAYSAGLEFGTYYGCPWPKRRPVYRLPSHRTSRRLLRGPFWREGLG